jgi:hypothetical protein
MNTSFITKLGGVLILSILIFSNGACSKSAVYESMSEIPRFGKHFLTVKPHRTTWVHKNQFGHGVGKIEMTLADFEDFKKEKGLQSYTPLGEMGDSWRFFEGCFDGDPKTKAYPVSGHICPSERACHLYAYFAPNTPSFHDLGTLFFFIQ